MQLAAVAVIRNEIDVVRPFLSHLSALFDHVLLLDHGSVDGTEAVLAGACRTQPGWTTWRVEIPGNHQVLFSTFAMRHVFETTDADIVLFLDADEFLDVPDRAALEAALAGIDGERTAGRFTWVDCVPDRRDGGPLEIGDAIWARSGAAPFQKIAIPRRLYDATRGAVRPSTGNHTIDSGDGGPVAFHPTGLMLHVPLRSVGQLRQKVVTGALSILARRDNAPTENSHWFDAVGRLADPGITDSDLIHLATCYGHRPDRWPEVGTGDLARLGFERRMLDVASRAIDLPEPPGRPDPWRVIATIVRDWRAEHGSDIDLILDGAVLRRAGPAKSREAHPEASAVVDPMIAALKDRLDLALAARDEAQAEAAALRASTSFRITAPLRAAARLVRRGG